MPALLTLAVFIAAFVTIYRGTTDRLIVMFAGACTTLLFGGIFDFYSPLMAADAIFFETLALIFGMSLLSAVLVKSGLIHRISRNTISYSRGNGWLVAVLFILLTYSFSLFVNNLAAMTVIIPMTLTICLIMGMNPIPLLIAEIIASNLGGASTMVGDFPNMIIASAADLSFLDFVSGMMVPCLVLLATLLLFMQKHRFDFRASKPAKTSDALGGTKGGDITHPFLAKLGIYTLITILCLFLFSDMTGLQPAFVAFFAGIILLELGGFKRDELITASGAYDIAFFACLFIMVGGVNAAGVLDAIVLTIENLGAGSITFTLLLFMWLAALVTIFLNAGPATAFFIPAAMDLYSSTNEISVWWALSLGVLAGSSCALTGATAGSLASTQLNNFLKLQPELFANMAGAKALDFKVYLRWGFPIMGIFLGISSVYIVLLINQ